MQARKASRSHYQHHIYYPYPATTSNRKYVPNYHDLVVTHSVDHNVQRETVLARSCVSAYPLMGLPYMRHSPRQPSFEPSTTARERAAAAGNPRAEDLLHIDRRRDPPTASAAAFSSTSITSTGSSAASHSTSSGTVQRYFIVDSTDALQKFGADAWERVVCVMTTGQAWQFRPYKWNEPRTLFHHGGSAAIPWLG